MCPAGPDGPRDRTPYGQTLGPANGTLPQVWDRLLASTQYTRRRAAIMAANAAAAHRTTVRGLAITPVKFGISFTRRTLNQANALGTHLPRWIGASLYGRHRDGPGPEYQRSLRSLPTAWGCRWTA